MLSPHLFKTTKFYENHGLGAAKNLYLLICLISVAKTVNLYKLKDHVGSILGKAYTDSQSHYKRLIRFFDKWANAKPLLHDLLRHNLQLLRKAGFRTLVMDGTSWKFGQTEIHYLVLAVLVGSVAVPIYWTQLQKLGASSQEERKTMINEAFTLFDLTGMTLLADREYIGKEWFKFLKNKGLNFVIRLKSGDLARAVNAITGRNYQAMYRRCCQRQKIVSKHLLLDQMGFTLVMMPNPKAGAAEPVMIFLTTLSNARYAADYYKNRWKIECMFKHLKTNGYHLEDLNLRDEGKTRLMMALVATSYLLAVKEGWHRRRKIPLKKYADGTKWPAVSIFREGLGLLIEKCEKLVRFLKYIHALLRRAGWSICKNVQ